MIILVIVSLLLGIVCGAWFFPPEVIPMLSSVADWALRLLMFSVGVSLGANKLILRHMRENGLTALVVPAAIIVSSMLGGWVTGLIFGMEPNVSIAIASGLGWYSMGGVMLANLAGAQIGAITFLANVFREIFACLIIPFVARHFNHYAAIAPAAATSGDTTLPIIMKNTDESIAVVSVLNGVICTISVPILIELAYHLF